MKNRVIVSIFVILSAISLCACAEKDVQVYETETETIVVEEISIVEEIESIEEITEVESTESESTEIETTEEEPEIQVNIKGVVITPQDNWTIVEYVEEDNHVIYQIEVEGAKYDVSLYTIDDIKLDQASPNQTHVTQVYVDLAKKYCWHDYRVTVVDRTDNGYAQVNAILDEGTRQMNCIIGDYGTFIMESTPYVLEKEISENVFYEYDSEDTTKKGTILLKEFIELCEIEGQVNFN